MLFFFSLKIKGGIKQKKKECLILFFFLLLKAEHKISKIDQNLLSYSRYSHLQRIARVKGKKKVVATQNVKVRSKGVVKKKEIVKSIDF